MPKKPADVPIVLRNARAKVSGRGRRSKGKGRSEQCTLAQQQAVQAVLQVKSSQVNGYLLFMYRLDLFDLTAVLGTAPSWPPRMGVTKGA